MKDAVDFLSNFKGLHIFVACDERERTNPPWHFHTPFENALPRLQERQKLNWGAYFTVNELDKSLDPERKRTKKMIKKIRAVFCEFDAKTDIPKFPLKPSIVVETSPGKYHFYWLTTTDNLEEWAGVQQRIVNDYGGDKNAKDITRFLRLPGFKHCKGEPHSIKLLDNNGKSYPWETITVAFPPDSVSSVSTPSTPRQEGQSKTLKDHDQDILFGRHFHGPTMAHLQRLKDGDPPYLIKGHLKNMFELAQNFRDQWQRTETEYQAAYNTIEYQVDEYVKTLTNTSASVVSYAKQYEIPDFPLDIMDKWPEPWPMIWRNYKRIPRTLDQCLLLPTVLVIHAFALNANYTNEWGKRPNLAFLNIAPSTGNKDVNSEDVLRSMLEILSKDNKVNIPFMKMVNGAEGITSDTAFLQCFSDDDLFWVNTEATHIFQQMAQAGASNSSVKALESKIIDVVDGGPIRGKRKAGKDGVISGIDDPNAQILLYAQPETISAYLKGNMVDSGLLGRMILHIPKNAGEDPFLDAFKRRENLNMEVDDDLIDLYSNFSVKNPHKKILRPSDEDLAKLQNWMMEIIKPLADGDHSVKMLKRIAVSAEQLYTVILGIVRKWDLINARDESENFDVECLFPLLEYWARCKMYVLHEFIDDSMDPLADAILDVVKDLVSGKIKANRSNKSYEKRNLIIRAEVYRVICSRSKLKRELDARGDTRNIRERVNRIIDAFIKDNVLLETTEGKATLIGFVSSD